MTAEEREIIDWVSEQNALHMQQSEQLDYLLDGFFRNTERLVDGTSKAQVDKMTQFEKIGLLERLSGHQEMIGHPMLREINQFVEEIKPHKDGFRTIDDFERASC